MQDKYWEELNLDFFYGILPEPIQPLVSGFAARKDLLYPSAYMSFGDLVDNITSRKKITLPPKGHIYRIQFSPPKEGTVEDVFFVLDPSRQFDEQQDSFLPNLKFDPSR